MDSNSEPIPEFTVDQPPPPRKRPIPVSLRMFVVVNIWLGVASVIALPLWWWQSWTQSMHDVFTGKTGAVPVRTDWPRPLKELLDDTDGIEVDESTIQVHCLCGGVYDQEFVWRMDATFGLFDLLEKRWKLTLVNGSDWGVLEGYKTSLTREQTPAWWSPRDDGETLFYKSPGGYDGDGEEFRVGVDENHSTVWVHYSYRF